MTKAMATATPVRERLRGRTPTTGPLAQARLRLLDKILPPDPLLGVRPGWRHAKTVHERQALYLRALADGASSVAWACRLAGLSVRIVFHWRQVDPAFVEREQMAQADRDDLLRAQLAAAAQESDTILVFMVKSLLPEYMKPVRQEHVLPDALPSRFSLQLTPPMPDGGA
jgi:hypothetical protein